jgi:hypothetical protein
MPPGLIPEALPLVKLLNFMHGPIRLVDRCIGISECSGVGARYRNAPKPLTCGDAW